MSMQHLNGHNKFNVVKFTFVVTASYVLRFVWKDKTALQLQIKVQCKNNFVMKQLLFHNNL